MLTFGTFTFYGMRNYYQHIKKIAVEFAIRLKPNGSGPVISEHVSIYKHKQHLYRLWVI